MQTERDIIIVLIITSTLIILLLTMIVILVLYLYQKKQLAFKNKINNLKTDFDKTILKSRLEIQEETMQHLSREIHDNIGLSLTLSKLNLNTLTRENEDIDKEKINNSIHLIGKAIADLSNISRSLNSDLINNNGLIRTLEEEISRIQKSTLIKFDLKISGTTRFLDNQKELIIFRIIQESINNIIKHSGAKNGIISLYYSSNNLELEIFDNGIGFDSNSIKNNSSGLINLRARTKMINGYCNIYSSSEGTHIKLIIPN